MPSTNRASAAGADEVDRDARELEASAPIWDDDGPRQLAGGNVGEG